MCRRCADLREFHISTLLELTGRKPIQNQVMKSALQLMYDALLESVFMQSTLPSYLKKPQCRLEEIRVAEEVCFWDCYANAIMRSLHLGLGNAMAECLLVFFTGAWVGECMYLWVSASVCVCPSARSPCNAATE